MKQKLLRIVLFVFICVFIVILYTYYIITPIKLSYVNSFDTSAENYGDYWVVVNNKDQLKGVDIDASELSFDGSSYIITFGRELKELKYKRLTYFPFTKTKYGIAYLGKEYHLNKMFVYRIPKNAEIFYDHRMMEKDNVRIEK